jgi:hypothetical protein
MILYAKCAMPYGCFKKARICLKLSAGWQCAIGVEVCIAMCQVCSQGRNTIACVGAEQKRKNLLEFHHDCLDITILTETMLPILFQCFQDNVANQTDI